MAKKKTPKSDLLPRVLIPYMEEVFDGDAEGAHGGIGLRHIEGPFVVYVILRPSDNVVPGSVVMLYWNNLNTPVAWTPIREEDKDKLLIPLTIAPHNVVEFWANTVQAKVRRPRSNESFTEAIKVRVRLHRPGGDPGPGPGHQGLQYEIPPEVRYHGVSEAVAQAGVKITIRYWLYMRAYDLIRLAWGSQTVERRVQPGEEGSDIVVTVDYETIKKAGYNPLTRVAYQVRDAGGNLPAEAARWSASTWIDVHLSEKRPDAPWLMFPNTYPNRIDLSELGSLDVGIAVWVTKDEIAVYSHLTFIWEGMDSEGNPVPHTETRELRGNGLYTFEVDNALVAAIAKGGANVHALYQKAGIELPSQKLYLDVFGQIVRWPAPQIKEDLGGHVDPDFDATVYFLLQDSWPAKGFIEVIFQVSTPDNSIEYRVGREVDDVPPTDNGNLEFTIPSAELKRFEGHLVNVFYAHTRPDSKPQESLRLEIIVGVLERTMPKPVIDKAIGGQLNPDDIGAYAKVFSTFTETLRSDWIRMFWIGPRGRTEVPVQVAVNGTTTEHDVDKSFVMDNLNENVLVYYTLTRGVQMPRYSQITEVLISRNLGDLPAPILLGANVTGPGAAELEPLNVQKGTVLGVVYPGMLDGDLIKVTMVGSGNGGSPDIAPKPGNQELQKVEFVITPAAIAANVRDHDTTVKFHYVVTRAGTSKTSGTLTVTLKPIPEAELVKTTIQITQANQLTEVLDLSAVVGGATARIGVWPFMAAGHAVWLSLTGFKNDGTPITPIVLWTGPQGNAVYDRWINLGRQDAVIAYDRLKDMGHNQKLTLVFKTAMSTSKVEADAIAFPLKRYTVINSLPNTFPVPTLIQATVTGSNSATLAPLNAQTGATVLVRFLPMGPSYSIKVTMQGTAGAGSPDIPAKPGTTSGEVTFDIPMEAIAANIGNAEKKFTLKYEVTVNGVAKPSEELMVTVTPIPDAELVKTVIKLNEANGTSVLNLGTFTGNATANIGVWAFIANTRPVWLRFLGKTATDVAHNYLLFNGAASASVNPNWLAAGQYEAALPRSYLNGLGHGKELFMEFKAALSGSKVEADAITFPMKRYIVEKPIPFYELTSFNNFDFNGWSRNPNNTEIKYESGNYFCRTRTDSSAPIVINIYKTLSLPQTGSYTLRVRYRVSAVPPGPTAHFRVLFGTTSETRIPLTEANVWISTTIFANISVLPCYVQIGDNNTTAVIFLDIDDIEIQRQLR